MNKGLASGHEMPQKTPATAMPDAEPIFLDQVPLIAAIEALIRAGKSWAPDFQKTVDEASVALFGLTDADTYPAPPHDKDFYKGRTVDTAAYNAAIDDFEELQADLWVPDADKASYDELIEWWLEQGVYVCGDDQVPLRCLSFIGRQMNAALFELLPNARLTLDGSGRAGSQSSEAWGAALAAQAEEFARRPKK